MAPSGIFFIPHNPSAAPHEVPVVKLTANLKKSYSLDQLPRWGLEHRLFRQTAPATNGTGDGDQQAKLFTIDYLQILKFLYKSDNTHVALVRTHNSAPAGNSEKSSEPAIILETPAAAGDDFGQLVFSRLGPLFTPRSMTHVTNGQAFEIGQSEFAIRYGELKQGQGSTQQTRGTVVKVEWNGGADDDWATAEAVIQRFWDDLDVQGARAIIRIPDAEKDLPDIRQWFDALRLRA